MRHRHGLFIISADNFCRSPNHFPQARGEAVRKTIRRFAKEGPAHARPNTLYVRHPPCHAKMDSRFRGNDRRRSGNDRRRSGNDRRRAGMTEGTQATFFTTSGGTSFRHSRANGNPSVCLYVRHPPCHATMDSRFRGNDRTFLNLNFTSGLLRADFRFTLTFPINTAPGAIRHTAKGQKCPARCTQERDKKRLGRIQKGSRYLPGI